MSLAGRIAVFTLVALFAVTPAFSSGFQLNEHGARAMGMGGAFAAQANDLSALYFNPAGLAYQKGFGFYLGGTAILPKTSYTSTTGAAAEMVSQTFLLPNVYLGYGLENGLSFGVGLNAPFGLGTEWPSGWIGRRLALKADIQAIAVNPTVAYRINEAFMIGAGVTWMTSKVKMKYNVPTYTATFQPAATDGEVSLDANGNAFSFDVGAIYKPMPELSIGAAYRHTIGVDLTGDAVFSNMQGLASLFPGGSGKATIKFPNQIFSGISYDLSKDITLEFDYQWVGWSSYDTLTVELPNGPNAPAPLGGKPLQVTSKSEKGWSNSYILRLGGEYRMDALSVRLGFIYDTTPQPNKTVEPLLPDANRVEGTVGLGYKFAGNWSVDVAYQFISFANRAVTGTTTGDLNKFPGSYTSSANLFGLSLGYSL